VAGEHHGQGVNQVVKLRHALRGQSVGQARAEGLEGRPQAVQAPDEGLVAGQAREPPPPILRDQAVHPLLLEAAL